MTNTIGLDEHIDLGPCCSCGENRSDVRNFIMLPYRAPVPGTGWGCFVCPLPLDGAFAIICDDCLKEDALTVDENLKLKYVVYGWPSLKGRLPFYALKKHPLFEHDMEKHSQMDGWSAVVEK